MLSPPPPTDPQNYPFMLYRSMQQRSFVLVGLEKNGREGTPMVLRFGLI